MELWLLNNALLVLEFWPIVISPGPYRSWRYEFTVPLLAGTSPISAQVVNLMVPFPSSACTTPEIQYVASPALFFEF